MGRKNPINLVRVPAIASIRGGTTWARDRVKDLVTAAQISRADHGRPGQTPCAQVAIQQAQLGLMWLTRLAAAGATMDSHQPAMETDAVHGAAMTVPLVLPRIRGLPIQWWARMGAMSRTEHTARGMARKASLVGMAVAATPVISHIRVVTQAMGVGMPRQAGMAGATNQLLLAITARIVAMHTADGMGGRSPEIGDITATVQATQMGADIAVQNTVS